MSKSCLRSLSLSISGGWPRIWAKVASEGSVSAFWGAGRGDGQKLVRRLSLSILGAGRRYGQKWSQKAQFEHFGGLAADMGKSWLRRPSRQVTSKLGFVHRCGVFERPSDRRTSRQVTSKCGFVHRCGVLEPWNLGFDDSCAVSSFQRSDLCTGAMFLRFGNSDLTTAVHFRISTKRICVQVRWFRALEPRAK